VSKVDRAPTAHQGRVEGVRVAGATSTNEFRRSAPGRPLDPNRSTCRSDAQALPHREHRPRRRGTGPATAHQGTLSKMWSLSPRPQTSRGLLVAFQRRPGGSLVRVHRPFTTAGGPHNARALAVVRLWICADGLRRRRAYLRSLADRAAPDHPFTNCALDCSRNMSPVTGSAVGTV
jgi:hypothetical protein